jgi:cobalt-zinc-cadmium efflux system outer membrane protein
MGTHLLMGARVRPRLVLQIGERGHLRRGNLRVRMNFLNTSVVLFLFLIWPPGAKAELAPPYVVLLRQAQTTSPILAEAEANIRAAQGRADQAGFLPNPSLGFTTENLGSKTKNAGFSAEQNTLSFSQPIELGGKRTARVSAGLADVAAAEAQTHRVAIDFAYELALAYAVAEAAQAHAELLQRNIDAAAEDLRAAQALVDAGREAQLRAVQARSALTAAQADLEVARAEREDSLARLSALVGMPAPYTGVPPSLLPLTDSSNLPSLTPPLEYPTVVAAEAAREAASRRVNIERTRPAPTISASLGVRRIAGEDSTLVVGGIVVPLPLFDNNRGNIAAALAELDAADARVRSARAEAETGWRSAVTQSIAAESRLAAARQAETTADQAYRLTRTGYDAGRTPLIEVLTAQRNLIDAQSRLLDSRLARIRAEAALARLAGQSPFGGTP